MISLSLKELAPFNWCSWKVLVLQLLKRSATTVSELHGSCWYQKKQILVLYKLMKSFFFSIFEFEKKFSLVYRTLKSASFDSNMSHVAQKLWLLISLEVVKLVLFRSASSREWAPLRRVRSRYFPPRFHPVTHADQL